MISVIGYDGRPYDDEARGLIAKAGVVLGGERQLAAADVAPGARVVVLGPPGPALESLRDDPAGDAVVLASGDPGWFGIARLMRELGLEFRVLPARTCVAQAFARVGTGWYDAVVASAHGRDRRRAVNAARAHRKVAVLTDADSGPDLLGRELAGWRRRLVVCERLGEPDERVTWCAPDEAAARTDWRRPNVVLVLADDGAAAPAPWTDQVAAAPAGWALPDTAFAHRDSMVTKTEVRALVLARLAPTLGTLIWDVGAGSGSVAVECARFGAAVVAVEADDGSCDRVAANAAAHGVEVRVVAGRAPEALAGLPEPDAVFVGGGGPEVVAAAVAAAPQRVVVTLATVERAGETVRLLAGGGYRTEGVLLSAQRLAPIGGGHRLAATNPVFVVWGERP